MHAHAAAPVAICYPFSGDSVGGSHISTLGLLERLDPTRYHPIVVPERADGRIAGMFAGFDRLPDPAAGRRSFVPGERFGLAKFARTLGGIGPRIAFLKRHGIDIVHINDGRTSADWAIAARLAGARLVWHHRGDPGALGLRLLAPAVADRVLAVSSFALPPEGLWSAADRAEVVHSPFDTAISVDRAEARAALEQRFGIAPDALVIGYFGSFVPRKRPLLFVDIMMELRRRTDRPVIGLMFGEARVPEMAAALDAHIAAADAGGTVRIVGYQTPGAFWIGACDQLVIPAVGEPFGRTLIEAMLVGTPIVAAHSGGNVEALEGGNGLLVPPDDAVAFADACARLCADPALVADLTGTAMRHVHRNFGMERHCERVTAIYDRLMRADGGGGEAPLPPA